MKQIVPENASKWLTQSISQQDVTDFKLSLLAATLAALEFPQDIPPEKRKEWLAHLGKRAKKIIHDSLQNPGVDHNQLQVIKARVIQALMDIFDRKKLEGEGWQSASVYQVLSTCSWDIVTLMERASYAGMGPDLAREMFKTDPRASMLPEGSQEYLYSLSGGTGYRVALTAAYLLENFAEIEKLFDVPPPSKPLNHSAVNARPPVHMWQSLLPLKDLCSKPQVYWLMAFKEIAWMTQEHSYDIDPIVWGSEAIKEEAILEDVRHYQRGWMQSSAYITGEWENSYSSEIHDLRRLVEDSYRDRNLLSKQGLTLKQILAVDGGCYRTLYEALYMSVLLHPLSFFGALAQSQEPERQPSPITSQVAENHMEKKPVEGLNTEIIAQVAKKYSKSQQRILDLLLTKRDEYVSLDCINQVNNQEQFMKLRGDSYSVGLESVRPIIKFLREHGHPTIETGPNGGEWRYPQQDY